MADHLGEFEQLVMLALLRLDENAYGVTVREELAERAGRDVAMGALYTTFDRLEKKGLISSRLGEPTAVRGGRRKKLYRLEPAGQRALSRSWQTLSRMTEGLEATLHRFGRETTGK